jgi:hypothetical protein
MDEAGDPRQRFDVAIFPYAHVAPSNAPLGCDGGRFNKDKARAAHSATAEVNRMPIVGHPILRRILAQRRNDNTILEV